MRPQLFLIVTLIAACSSEPGTLSEECNGWLGPAPALGATLDTDGCLLSVRVYSSRATRVEVWLYPAPTGAAALTAVLAREPGSDVWSTQIDRAVRTDAGLGADMLYGLRAWGPNWDYDSSWSPGSSAGLSEDVDSDGNRFNPNKLLVDPYALETTHDPGTDMARFTTGPDNRDVDTGRDGPKGVVLTAQQRTWQRPTHHRSEDVIYEVHLRGLTRNDDGVPENLRGTYAGAALKAPYLAALGVTAVEFLPIHETNNEFNGEVDGQAGGNYWGYSSLSFFAPERRYSSDVSPGGPTREFRDMVAAFHAEGIKVYVDVVYNHTAETGVWDVDGRIAPLLSWRGLDNATYYQRGDSGRTFRNDNGVGPNVATANAAVADMVIDSLRYWHDDMGVDGFRFDLATLLGNSCAEQCFNFSAAASSLLARIGSELATADLVAEPWSATDYQLGGFLDPWAEWNDSYRDTVRRHLNKFGVEAVTPRELTTRLAGSVDRFGDDGRKPWHSVNFVVAHDGFTLRDLFSCNDKNNGQPWPYGPSPGGSNNNISWDNGGDPLAQRQAARTAMALLLLSPGVPMMTGGDEFLRSMQCNNNAFNLDNDANWLDWQAAQSAESTAFADFIRFLTAFRQQHASLRPLDYWRFDDGNSNGVADATWLTDTGAAADAGYLDDAGNTFIALELDGSEATPAGDTLYVGYNGFDAAITASLPPAPQGTTWRIVLDSSSAREATGNSALNIVVTGPVDVAPHSIVVAVAAP